MDDVGKLEDRVRVGEWLRPGEIAVVLGLSRSKVDVMLRSGELGYRFKPATTHRICNPEDVLRLLDASREQHGGDTVGPGE